MRKTITTSLAVFLIYSAIALQVPFLAPIFWLALVPFLMDFRSKKARQNRWMVAFCLLLGSFLGFAVLSLAPFFADSIGDIFGIIVLVILASFFATTVLLLSQLDTLRIFLQAGSETEAAKNRAKEVKKAAKKKSVQEQHQFIIFLRRKEKSFTHLFATVNKTSKRATRKTYKFLVFGSRRSRRKPLLTKIGLELLWWMYVAIGAGAYFLVLETDPIGALVQASIVLLFGIVLALFVRQLIIFWQEKPSVLTLFPRLKRQHT